MPSKERRRKNINRLYDTIDNCAEFIEELNQMGVFEPTDYIYLQDLVLCIENSVRACIGKKSD